jgi:hypothetical protein
MLSGYVAPARYVLTVLHRLDPDREADLTGQPDRIDGYTVCGLPLLESGLWVPVEYLEGDTICPKCETGSAGKTASEVQGKLL